ncbi:hypothetical protein ETAA8_49140 [Anatilimnocola aggregata]|uniref:Uncharacterized protein n=1 Tax=Anatilimnocola aggregata TaxID=2528021 RepID=A0A517YHV7_9BACT|nr:hypothetical protein [Anatilimnocola aggregata]QDU29799.1 hypothetical protein ETAA8_49140 [Anatilimnocola aggregata]
MHTVEMRERMIRVAEELGYSVRQEWLGGAGGGLCEFGGRRHIFLDLALSAVEQLDQLAAALQQDPAIHSIRLPLPLQPLLGIRRAA